jgi:hypothetical protein
MFCAWAALGALAVLAADSAQELLSKTRANVVDNLKRFPRYVCVQTVTRREYQFAPGGSDCGSAIAAKDRNQGERILHEHDRLRLDVAVGDNADMYSWAGASKFETGDISHIVARGTSGSGEFASFLTGVFAGDAQRFTYSGEKDLPAGRLAVFDFAVPVERSHYRYTVDAKEYVTIGYRGSFLVEPATADLRELDVDVSEFPPSSGVCRVQDRIEYARTKIGDDTFLLPSYSTMDVIYRNFTESFNETTFSGCREYVGDSTIRFNVDDSGESPEEVKRRGLPKLPPKTHIRVHIDPPIDSRTAAAGDPITGVVISRVKKKGVVLVNAGDKLHGRIVRLEQVMGRAPRWTVAIVFNTIERNGIQEPVLLAPDDDGERSAHPNPERGNEPRPEGGGVFSFQRSGDLVLDRNFVSAWETR